MPARGCGEVLPHTGRTPGRLPLGQRVRYGEVIVIAETKVSRILRSYLDKTPASAERYQKALDLFPSGVTHHARYLKPHPVYVSHAKGSRKWDVDGNEYVDYFGGHGALILGHCHPAVVEAVGQQIARGTHFGACHELEIEWASLIRDMVPCAETIRFTSSGTEATHLALRVARAYTGKSKVVKFGGHFHGWHDYVASGTIRSGAGGPSGIPREVLDQVIVVPPNDMEALDSVFNDRDDVAAVILEPTGATFGAVPTGVETLRSLRDLTRRHGVVLIFDEVVTGFRCSPGGAQAYYGVTPDLATFAKIVAGGYPGAALVGRADILRVMEFGESEGGIVDPAIVHQGTFNASPVSAVAGITTLRLLQTTDVISRANETAAAIRGEMNSVLRRLGASWCAYGEFSGVHIFTNPDSRPVSPEEIYAGKVRWETLKKSASTELAHKIRLGFLCEGVDVLPWPGGLVSGVHDRSDVERTVTAFENVVKLLAEEGDLAGC